MIVPRLGKQHLIPSFAPQYKQRADQHKNEEVAFAWTSRR